MAAIPPAAIVILNEVKDLQLHCHLPLPVV